MSLSNALNIFFGSSLIIIIVFAECAIKYTGNRKTKKMFCALLIIALAVLTIDFALSFFVFNHITNIFYSLSKLIWPFISALFLYLYLFVILKENRTDNLTGLGNRYSFFEFFNKLSHNKTGDTWEIAMLDIKNFKSINSIYGHLEGDNALCNLAKIIKSCAKKTDFTARYGGDEFILITRAETGINKLITSIEDELVKLNEKSEKLYNIEISYGFDSYTADGDRQIDDFLNHIDRLMHSQVEESRRAGDLKT